MKLYYKLLLFTVAAAVLPLTAVGFTLLRGSERALEGRIAGQQLVTARGTAEAVGHHLESLLGAISDASNTYDWADLDAAELHGMLLVLYKRSPEIDAVGLLTEDGHPALPPVASDKDVPAEVNSPLAGHSKMTEEGMRRFLSGIPVRQTLEAKSSLVIGTPYQGAEGRTQVVISLSVPAPEKKERVLGVLLSLQQIRNRVVAAAGPAGAVVILDDDGRVVTASSPGKVGAVAPPADKAVMDKLRGMGGGTAAYVGEGGGLYLAAYAPVPGGAGWGALLRLPADQAFAEVRRMRYGVLFWTVLSLVLFVVLGWLFIRRVDRGIAALEGAAVEFGKGNLAVRLDARGKDEIAQVSRTFNQLGEELAAARARLQRWNEELQQKVEERTRELREAQAQLLEAQKLAAIGQLGAGVAHEINNPLAGILGNVQLLLAQKKEGEKDWPALKKMEELSKRCREITTNLLRFSQQRSEPDFQDVDLNRVVKEALTLAEGQVRGDGIALEVRCAERLPPVKGDPGHLAQVLLNLLANARTACKGREGATITVETRIADAEVALAVRDNGKGIAPEVLPRIFEPFFTTKDVWSNVGLGLSVSFRIVAEHGGRISVDSKPGAGATFVVSLPPAVAASARAAV